jgi:adenylosuccinate synthase
VRLGVVRTYTTRHGPGPFVTEDPVLTADLVDAHNAVNRWQGTFRVGHFDAVAHRYARDVAGGVDALAVTHVDVAVRRRDLKVCAAYSLDGTELRSLVPGQRGDLAAQERLTQRLLRARPVYDEPPSARSADAAVDWLDLIGTTLQAPVALASHGPARNSKSAGTAWLPQNTGHAPTP